MTLLQKIRAKQQADGPAIAKQWIDKGFRVTPVAPAELGNKASGKSPAIAGDGWWSRAHHKDDFDPSKFVGRNVGICGGYELEGGGWLAILDPDGAEGLANLAALGELPRTLTVKSGSGTGKHYYYRSKKQCGGCDLAEHVNVRGRGGQAVAPGCLHYSGNRYEVEVDAPIAWAPDWLEEKLYDAHAVRTFADLDKFTPVELTPAMLRTRADELGREHPHYRTLDLLALGEPLAGRGSKHEAADLQGNWHLVQEFGPGITNESVMRLMAPTYPGWSLEPIGPGSDWKNWNDCNKGLLGAKLRYEEPAIDFKGRLQKRKQEREELSAALQNFVATERMLTAATTALKNEIKLVEIDYNRLESAAYRLGRYVPHVLHEAHVHKELFKAATQRTVKSAVVGCITDAEANEKIANGVKRGQKNPLFVYSGWKKQLVRDAEKGTIVVCDENAALFFQHHPDVEGLLRHNVRKGKPFFEYAPPWQTARTEFPAPVEDHDAVDAGRWLAEQMGKPMAGAERTLKALNTAAMNQQYDPFRTWLEGLKWDGVPRLDSWLHKVCGVEDNEYHRLVGSKFVLSAVARTLEPGCDAQYVLVLVGPQGLGKSKAFRVLAGAEYFCSNIGDIHKEEAIFNLEKYVIVELAELAAFKKAEMEVIKRFISDTNEDLRRKYARNSETIVRRAVFGGTTNVREFLQDPTGNRRFWPVECAQALDLEWLELFREQLWAEALQRKRSGEIWWPTRDQEKLLSLEQEKHLDEDDLAERLSLFETPFVKWPDHVLGQAHCTEGQVDAGTSMFKWVTIPQVHMVLGTTLENRADQVRVKKMCLARGWELRFTKISNKSTKIWLPRQSRH